MITKMMTFKNEFKIQSRTHQESRIKFQDSSFENQESSFNIQDSSFKNQESRINKLKIQESRKDSIKISTKKFFKTWITHEFFTKPITKEFLLSDNRLTVYCNRLPVAKWFSKSFQLNLQRFNWFQNVVIDYNDLVINYQCVWTLKFKLDCEESHPFTKKLCVIDYNDLVIDYQWLFLNKIKRCNSSNSFPVFLKVITFPNGF